MLRLVALERDVHDSDLRRRWQLPAGAVAWQPPGRRQQRDDRHGRRLSGIGRNRHSMRHRLPSFYRRPLVHGRAVLAVHHHDGLPWHGCPAPASAAPSVGDAALPDVAAVDHRLDVVGAGYARSSATAHRAEPRGVRAGVGMAQAAVTSKPAALRLRVLPAWAEDALPARRPARDASSGHWLPM